MADALVAWETAASVIVALGGGGAIVAALSNWLGKVWAERIMAIERDKHDRSLAKLRADLEKQNADALEDLKARNAQNLQRLSAILELEKGKLAGAHTEKLTIYRSVIELTVEIIMVRQLVQAGVHQVDPLRDPDTWTRFERARLVAHGQLAIFAPQSVLDAYSELSDYFLDVADGAAQFDFRRVRELAFVMLNRIRQDLNIDPSPVAYRGRR